MHKAPELSRDLFEALQEAASICRSSLRNTRTRRLLAEIDLLRAAVAVTATEPTSADERICVARLVFAVRDEALELDRDVRLAREATAAMMD